MYANATAADDWKSGLTLHGHHKVVKTVLIEFVSLLVVLLDIFVDRLLHNLDRFLQRQGDEMTF